MKCCTGDVQKADAFMDCNIFEFHYRIQAYNRYANWYNEQMKPKD